MEAESAEGVDTATGHLMLSRNDLSLDGTGGMDFELNRYYDSNEANLGHATVDLQDKINLYISYIETKQYNQIYPDKEFDIFIWQIYYRNKFYA